jgi:ABC-2 type transport system permease protein
VKALWAQAAVETRLTLRRGESLLLALGIPVGLLAFLSLTRALPKPSDQLSYLVPGVLALAIMSTGMVSLGIATAFEREYMVLKRLGSTPLGRPRLVAAKVASVTLVEVLQAMVIVGVAFALGWRGGGASHGSGAGTAGAVVSALAAAVTATSGFAGIGLLMAGRLRADIVLALANGLWLVLLLFGGMLFPLSRLPGPLRDVAQLLPGSALAGALRASLGTASAVPTHDWAVLAAWALAAPVLAALTFRWD